MMMGREETGCELSTDFNMLRFWPKKGDDDSSIYTNQDCGFSVIQISLIMGTIAYNRHANSTT